MNKEQITMKEKAKKIINDSGYFTESMLKDELKKNVLNIMIEFAKLACEEQKKICTKYTEFTVYSQQINQVIENTNHFRDDVSLNTFDVNEDSILNSPTVKFD